MKNVIIGAVILTAAAIGYLVGGRHGTSKSAPTTTKEQQQALKKKSKRQQRPAKTTAANLAALQRMTKRSRKKDAKLQKARTKR